jgi:hypothetical protein
VGVGVWPCVWSCVCLVCVSVWSVCVCVSMIVCGRVCVWVNCGLNMHACGIALGPLGAAVCVSSPVSAHTHTHTHTRTHIHTHHTVVEGAGGAGRRVRRQRERLTQVLCMLNGMGAAEEGEGALD